MKPVLVSAAAMAALVLATIDQGLAVEPGSSTKSVLELRPVIEKTVNEDLSRLKDIYEDIHRHPELSYHEERTATKLAGLMRELGFTRASQRPPASARTRKISALPPPGRRARNRAGMTRVSLTTSKSPARKNSGRSEKRRCCRAPLARSITSNREAERSASGS